MAGSLLGYLLNKSISIDVPIAILFLQTPAKKRYLFQGPSHGSLLDLRDNEPHAPLQIFALGLGPNLLCHAFKVMVSNSRAVWLGDGMISRCSVKLRAQGRPVSNISGILWRRFARCSCGSDAKVSGYAFPQGWIVPCSLLCNENAVPLEAGSK